MEFLMNLSEGTQFIIQLAIVLICLFYGAKKGGVALGMLGGVGLLVLVFCFGIQPGKPAIDVMLVILAVVVASATLQSSGGLDVMLQIAERILRRNPKYVSILAPFVTSTLTILCGTGHVVYTILPIIYDIAIKNNIRPERPMAASTIAAQMGIIASPVSVAVVSLTAFLLAADSKLAGFDGYVDLLKITIPATYFGVLCVGIFSWFRGKDLDKDPEFQAKIADPEQRKYIYGADDNATLLNKNLRPSWPATKDAALVEIIANTAENKVVEKISLKDAKISVGGVDASVNVAGGKIKNYSDNISSMTITNKDGSTATLSVDDNGVNYTLADGSVKNYPDSHISLANKTKSTSKLSMVHVIQIFMLLAGAIILIVTGTNAANISKNEVFRSGMIARVAVFGISWMAETMFGIHTPMMKAVLGDIVKEHPWTYAIMLLLISKFVNSQAAALVAFVPLALAIGVSPAIILAFAPACYGYYILPTYPSDLAGIQFDRSGTTHIGKYVINHSFIFPGLIGVFFSCVAGYILTGLYGYFA